MRTPRGQFRPPGPGRADPRPGLAALLGQVAAGDGDAFEALYDRLAPTVFGLASRVLRDCGQAEEVTQDVLIEVWRTAARFDPGRGSAMAWVTTIAHRRAVDRVRAEQRMHERLLRAGRPAAISYDEVAETVQASLDRQRVLTTARTRPACPPRPPVARPVPPRP